jgi:tRNA(fMet)-specific endonuclease VapC
MTRYLLDTNHASTFWRKRHLVAARLQAVPDARFGLCLPSIGELWYMVFKSARVDSNSRELDLFLRDYVLWEYDSAAAVEFGRLKADLRKAGRPIPDVDVQIAAIARVNQLILLTADAHFVHVDGLMTESWIQAP